ncbi:hypothetical protein [Sutcliffiella halmapala]|uniref:hypothetical protein n=1 Tax=Sutcliffiella halmapala TaxID=79882 RepID=UPI000994FB52|nr:hypothetical protein [Sutcliffiella halmapala]
MSFYKKSNINRCSRCCSNPCCCLIQGPRGPQGPQGPPGPGFTPPSPVSSQTVYVSKGGNDVTGDGTIANPFATIPRGMIAINDASPTKRYSMKVGPGNFVESFSLKANVVIDGTDPVTTRIGDSGSFININDPSWASSGDHRSGFQNLAIVASNVVFDFTVQSSVEGKLYFMNMRSNFTPVFTAFHPINQVIIQDSIFFAGYTQNGINMILPNTDFINAGVITVNSSPFTAARLQGIGGGTDGSVVITQTPGHPAIITTLHGFSIGGALTATGSPLSTISATVNSIPINTSISGGIVLTRINEADALGYTPGNPADWTTPLPTTVQEAIDRIANFIVGPIT